LYLRFASSGTNLYWDSLTPSLTLLIENQFIQNKHFPISNFQVPVPSSKVYIIKVRTNTVLKSGSNLYWPDFLTVFKIREFRHQSLLDSLTPSLIGYERNETILSNFQVPSSKFQSTQTTSVFIVKKPRKIVFLSSKVAKNCFISF
jgi:hypothetical protein